MRNVEVTHRKISKIGNSYGVTIPSALLDQVKWQLGDSVELRVVDGKIVIHKERRVVLPDGISEDFFEGVQETFERYDSTIKGLIER